MAIIGISGKAQSGKSTIGDIVKDLTNNEFKIIQFANPIKQFITEILGCTREQLEDESFKNTELGKEWDKYNLGGNKYVLNEEDFIHNINVNDPKPYIKSNLIKLTPRKLMQLIGTDMGRIIHPNIWINATMRDYVPVNYPTLQDPSCEPIFPNWVISDVRFTNEVKSINDRDGFVIRVNKVREVPLEECVIPINSPLLHPSETSLDNYTFKYTIDNNGTIEELIDNVKEILIKEQIL